MSGANRGKVDDGEYPGEADGDTRDFESAKAPIAPDHDERVNCNCLKRAVSRINNSCRSSA
jgi:hypothetical protein